MALLGPDGRPVKLDRARLTRRIGAFAPRDAYAWTVEAIRATRSAHIDGRFSLSAQLVTAMKTDAAIYAALLQRIAPSMGLPRGVTGRGERIRKEAEATFGAGDERLQGALADVFESVAMLGIAVLQVIWEPRPDGTRLDARLEPWPMAQVWWDAAREQLVAQTTEGLVDIVHGDGKWVVCALHTSRPWTWGAVLPLALLWPDRAYGIRSRSQSAEAHGQAHPIGELPEGLDTDDDAADALGEVLQQLHEARKAILLPAGTKVSYLESMSQNWRIFDSLIASDDGQIARVLLGQDGTATAGGGNYVKDSVLFGVRNDIIERDTRSVAKCLTSGLLHPWALVNFGDTHDLSLRWLMPDPDEDARRQSIADRTKAYTEAIQAYRSAGFAVDQDIADRLAAQYGVMAPPLAAVVSTGFVLAPTDLARAITANEARSSVGLPTRPDGEVPLSQYGVSPPAPPADQSAPREPSPPAPLPSPAA